MDCATGCGRQAAPGRPKCWACYRQQARTGSTRRKEPDKGTRYATPKAMVLEAHNAFEDSDHLDTDAHTKAWARLRKAWRRYFEKTTHKAP